MFVVGVVIHREIGVVVCTTWGMRQDGGVGVVGDAQVVADVRGVVCEGKMALLCVIKMFHRRVLQLQCHLLGVKLIRDDKKPHVLNGVCCGGVCAVVCCGAGCGVFLRRVGICEGIWGSV